MISNSVTSIGNNTFNNCSKLTNVIIGNGVTSIGDNAFYGCTNLMAITVDAENSFYSSSHGVLFDKAQTTLVEYPGGLSGSYNIPGGVTNIGNEAFEIATLRSVTIPDSVTSIGDSAFYGCTSLTNVTIGKSVTNIGDSAFGACTSLTSVTIANGITSIGESMFYYCLSLTSITIPKSVSSIGAIAFYDCLSLTEVYFESNAPSVGDPYVFKSDNVTAYYLPGTIGWEVFSSDTGISAVLWNPQAQTSDGSFGVQTNKFGFNITGSSNLVIVVEACTNLANPVWTPVGTNTLSGGSSYFSDPQWTNYPGRFYRLRSP